MKKILITGGAGFIGSNLAEKLINNNFVVALDNFDPYYSPDIKHNNIKSLEKKSNFYLVEGDIRNSSLIQDTFKKYHPETIVHLAARVGVRDSLKDPNLYAHVNILGTINLLEAAKVFNVKNFIFASSSSVYGSNKKLPFSEKDRVDSQKSPYAVTKRSIELLCQQYSQIYNIPITCLRLFTVYGPRQRPDMAITKFIKNISEGKPIQIYGDGTSMRDFVYIDDVIDAFLKCIDKRSNFEIFNIGCSSPIKLNQLINIIERILGKKAKKSYNSKQIADMEKTYADTNKAKKYLNWQAETDIENGLQRAIDFILVK